MLKALAGLLLSSLLVISSMLSASELPACPKPWIRFAHFAMGMMYSNGVGIDKDLVDEMIRRSGCPIRLDVLPRARIWLELEHGQLDMAASAIRNDARDKFAWFAPYMWTKNYLVQAAEVRNIDSMDQFLANQSLKLGVVRSFKHGDYFDSYLPKLTEHARLSQAVDMDMLFRMLNAKRFEAVIVSPPVYTYYLKQYPLLQVRTFDWDPSSGFLINLVMSKQAFSEEQAVLWRQLIDGIRADGTLEKIVRKHLSSQDAEQALNF
jgi:polar amino acid transport system substrate-binding protein